MDIMPATVVARAGSSSETSAAGKAKSVMARKHKPTYRELAKFGEHQAGGTLPGIPKFPTFAAERRHIVTRIAAALRSWARQGFTQGQGGHISAIDPEFPRLMWMNQIGKHLSLLTAADMLLVDMATGYVVGWHPSRTGQPRVVSPQGCLMHAAIHEARPDVRAVGHTHSDAGRAWSVFARPLDMITQDVRIFYGDEQAVYTTNGKRIVFDREEAVLIAKTLGKARALIMTGHGLVTTGYTVDECAYMFSLLDRCCKIQLAVEAASAGNPALKKHLASEAEAAGTHATSIEYDQLWRDGQPDIQLELALAGGEHVLAAGADEMIINV